MGLSAPHPEFDSSFWEEGTYSASRQVVETNIRVAERPRIHLIEGFFADSLVTAEAAAYSEVPSFEYCKILISRETIRLQTRLKLHRPTKLDKKRFFQIRDRRPVRDCPD